MPGKASQPVRGVFTLEPEALLSGASVFLETPHPGLTLRFDQPPKVVVASDLSDPAVTPLVPDGILDKYRWEHSTHVNTCTAAVLYSSPSAYIPSMTKGMHCRPTA